LKLATLVPSRSNAHPKSASAKNEPEIHALLPALNSSSLSPSEKHELTRRPPPQAAAATGAAAATAAAHPQRRDGRQREIGVGSSRERAYCETKKCIPIHSDQARPHLFIESLYIFKKRLEII
jgi:hypothetical protein